MNKRRLRQQLKPLVVYKLTSSSVGAYWPQQTVIHPFLKHWHPRSVSRVTSWERVQPCIHSYIYSRKIINMNRAHHVGKHTAAQFSKSNQYSTFKLQNELTVKIQISTSLYQISAPGSTCFFHKRPVSNQRPLPRRIPLISAPENLLYKQQLQFFLLLFPTPNRNWSKKLPLLYHYSSIQTNNKYRGLMISLNVHISINYAVSLLIRKTR